MPRRCLLCGVPEVADAEADEASAGIDVCGAHRIAHGLFRVPHDGGVPFGAELGLGPLVSPRCARCLALLPPGMSASVSCRACIRKPPGFKGTAAAFDYGQSGVPDWILRFKHGARADLAQPLARIARLELAKAVEQGQLATAPGPGDLLVPVPLHPARLAERGYNQASLVARELARLVGAHFMPVLERSRSTFVQGELAAPSRRLNVQGAFRTVASIDLGRVVSKRHRVWVVDDVMTTGSTASACATALRRAGGGEVRVVVLARA